MLLKTVLLLVATLSLKSTFAAEPTSAQLKAEITRLQSKVNEQNVQIGELEMALDEANMHLAEKPQVLTKTKLVPYPKYKTTRLSLLAGSQSDRHDMVSGVQLQRLLTPSISFGGQMQSNKTVLLNLGFDF